MTVRETAAMIAGMTPSLEAGELVFCTTSAEDLAARAMPMALGWFRETEGVSLILECAVAEALGFEAGIPMRRITLQVHSALDGVGLTAAVAAALSAAGIPCNMVAAYHHDHVFVPSAMAREAAERLRTLQAGSGD
jgi:hypothetical protein